MFIRSSLPLLWFVASFFYSGAVIELIPGNYTLIASRKDDPSEVGSASAFVNALPVLLLFPKDRRVLEGDRLNIYCGVSGFPQPDEVRWRFSPIKPESMDDQATLEDAAGSLATLTVNTTHYKFITDLVDSDSLYFESLPKEFNGLYECSVGTAGDGDRSLILVNVKDRWAALWPFTGIVVEVTVLVTIILLYERHQMRSKQSKPDIAVDGQTSPSTKQMHNPNVQQQNNLTVPVAVTDNGTEESPDGAKEDRNTRQDDLRQRGIPINS